MKKQRMPPKMITAHARIQKILQSLLQWDPKIKEKETFSIIKHSPLNKNLPP
jgi:hypothetical protein